MTARIEGFRSVAAREIHPLKERAGEATIPLPDVRGRIPDRLIWQDDTAVQRFCCGMPCQRTRMWIKQFAAS